MLVRNLVSSASFEGLLQVIIEALQIKAINLRGVMLIDKGFHYLNRGKDPLFAHQSGQCANQPSSDAPG